MNNLKTIAKYGFKEHLFPFNPKKILARYPKNYAARLLLFAFSYVFLGFFFFFFAGASGIMYLVEQNNEAMYFGMFGVILTLLLLTMYIPQMISHFFKAEEINIMKTWPVGEGELYMGRFFGVILSNFDFILFFLIYLIMYFLDRGFSLSRLILGPINFFCLIMIPYAIVTGLILLLLKFTNIGSHKKMIKNIGYIILFIIIGAIYYASFTGGKQAGSTGESMDLTSIVSTLAGISNVFFNAKLFGLAMSGSIIHQLTYTLILIAVTGLICFLLYKLADRYYFEAITESAPSKKRVKVASSDVDFRRRSVVDAIAKRDIKNLFSNIVFLAQGITFLVIFGAMALAMGSKLGTDLFTGAEFPGVIRFWVFMAGFLLSSLIWTTAGFGINSLSREHKSFYLFQTLPIRPVDHYAARFKASFLVTEIFNLAIAIIFTIFLKLGLINGILVFLGLSLGAMVSTHIGLWLGTSSINVNWKKPEELTKGGVRFMIIYLLSMVFIFLMIGAYALMIALTGGNHNVSSLVMLIVIIGLSIVISKLAIKSYERGFFDV